MFAPNIVRYDTLLRVRFENHDATQGMWRKPPNGHCGLGGAGLSCPIGVGPV